ncbi:hypothetical protein GCM10010862_10320 [Devosia nitrariae]|uniref:Transferrin-binding protein B C-lobe/N-lobe beta-barrel domain-containing protein n=2 Tax=Devosia nitrariae TaxID=2071872 RepID=A0ABQ5W193_9HYPH|nr:hypothetical protein GCM10010862_10320 [Devosia nitrariae]
MAYNATMSSSLEDDWNTDERRAQGSNEFSIKKNDQGGVDVTIDGETISYSATDVDGDYGWSKETEDGLNRDLYTAIGGTAEEVLAGAGRRPYHQIWSYFWDTGNESRLHGVAVVGAETRSEALEGKANATYSGWGLANIYPDDEAAAGYERARIEGELNMAADFNASTISGAITDLSTETRSNGTWSASQAIAGSVAMDNAAIAGNEFSGNLTPSANLTATVGDFTGTYAGKFFGPNGEEVGGVLSITGDDAVGTGFFSADED